MQKNLEILHHSISPPLIVALLSHVLATHQATAGEQNNHLLIHKKNIATIATYNTMYIGLVITIQYPQFINDKENCKTSLPKHFQERGNLLKNLSRLGF